MIFFAIGILLFAIAKQIAKLFPNVSFILPLLRYTGLAIAIISLSNASVKQIEAGQVGVQTLFGKVQPTVLESGLNTINPFVEVNSMDIKTQNYTMSAISTEGEKSGDDAIRALSADGLEVILDLTILYSVIPAEASRIYREIGLDYRNTVVRPIAR